VADAVLLGQSQHTEDTAHGHFPLPLVQSLAQRAHVRFSYGDTMRQLLRAGRSSLGTVLFLDAIAAALLP